MPYRVAAGDPIWGFDFEELEKQLATFLKNQGVTTDAGRAAFVGDTAAQFTPAKQLLFLQGLANSLKVKG